jgi:integrase
VNYEVGSLRGILRQFGLWGPIADRVRALPERHDVGQAISAGDEVKLIASASSSRSPALLPLLVLSLDTGMRASEVQGLRRRDLGLNWVNGDIVSGEVIVPRSKTAAGTGRVIPFTRRVCACLSLWLSRFPDTTSENFVFPFHQVGIGGNSRVVGVYDVDLERPMGSWRKAWLGACKNAGVRYRWHDLRHTFKLRVSNNTLTH